MFVTSQQKSYSKIRTMILEGEFKSGERIPEMKVAEIIGMKRGTVRESLIKLESDGLLVSEPHFGFAVRKYTIDEAKKLCELREVVEGGAAGLAAKNASQADIDRLVKAHHAFKEKIETNKVLSESPDATNYEASNKNQDEAFHRAILRASQNERFESLFDNIHDEHICLTLYYKGENFYRFLYDIEAYKHHQVILDAIISRDSEKAELEARLHIQKARQDIIRVMETLGDDVYLA